MAGFPRGVVVVCITVVAGILLPSQRAPAKNGRAPARPPNPGALCSVHGLCSVHCAWTSGPAVSRPAVTVLSVSRSLCVALRGLYGSLWESRAMYALFVVTYGVVWTAGSSGAGVTAKGCAVCNPQIHHRVCIVSHAVSHAVAETPQGLRRGRG